MFFTRKMIFTAVMIASLGISFCAKNYSGESEPSATAAGQTGYTYNSTTNKGDLVTYHIRGSRAVIHWQVVNETGGVKYVYQVHANCGQPNLQYDYRSCHIQEATCHSVLEPCEENLPEGDFKMLEVPGTALFVEHDKQAATENRREFHAGFISGGCPDDVSGEYVFARIGRGDQNDGNNVFGAYQVNADFTTVSHADFGFVADAFPSGNVSYLTDAAKSTESFGNMGCTEGIFTRTNAGTDPQILRANFTSSGMFILDMPSGQGGLVSLRTDRAAALADFADRQMVGIAFPDNDDPDFVNARTGGLSGSMISLNQVFFETQGEKFGSINIRPIADDPRFATPAGYSASPLATSYPAINQLPGVFVMDQGPDDNGGIIMIGSVVNGQVLGVGTVFNFRDHDGNGCHTDRATSYIDPTCEIRLSGNFVIYSK